MKKIILCFSILIALFSFHDLSAQRAPVISDIFCEDFDSDTSQWMMRIDSFPSPNDSSWVRDTVITASPTSFGSAKIQVGRTSGFNNRSGDLLTTPNMYIDTFISVAFSFDHICYLAIADEGAVEYSFDGGTTWRRVPEENYNGSSLYDASLPGVPGPPIYKFSKLSQATKWQIATNNFVWTPSNSRTAWERENFDMTSLIDAQSTKPDSMMLRFGAYDAANSAVGPEGDHFWWIDNFCVTGGDCDLVPPEIELLPPINYPGVDKYDGRVYLGGPWIFDAKVTDNKGLVDTVFVSWWLLREGTPGLPFDTIYFDTVGMPNINGIDYSGQIERFYDPINDPTAQIVPGDSIIWEVNAFDGSSCRNPAGSPPNGRFQVRPELPPSCNTSPVFSFPYYEDFNSSDWNSSSANEKILVRGWDNVTGDFEDWRVTTGESSPGDPTPFKISDDFPGGGNYLRVESGSPGDFLNGKLAFLNSPCFDFTELRNGNVRFYLNMNTAGLEDSIKIDYYDPTPLPGFPLGKFVENVIPPVKGNKGDQWLPYEFSILPLRNYVTQIRWGGVAGRPDGLGDMGLDSVSIVPAPELDLRMNSVDLDAFVPQGPNSITNGFDQITVNLQNIGVDPQTGFELSYQVYTLDENGNRTAFEGVKTETFNSSIPAASNLNYTFTNTYRVPRGRFEVEAWLVHTPDLFPNNDTSSSTANGIPVVNGEKYMDDFDKDTIWTPFSRGDSLSNKWELGTPDYNYTSSAYSPPNSWDILLNTGYTGDGGLVSLVSPFMNFTTVDDAIMSFINNRASDTIEDGMFVQYSFDRGRTWAILEGLNDPGRIRWNNSNLSSVDFGGIRALSGNSYCFSNGKSWNGYIETDLRLPPEFNFKPEVLLRFNFSTRVDDAGNDGISIDNFLVYDPAPLDLQVQHYLSPGSQCDLQTDQRFETIVKNRGLDTVFAFNMEYIVKHIPTGVETILVDPINRTIPPRDTLQILSQSTFNMFTVGDYDVRIIAKLPGDMCTENDTLRKLVENVDGCSLQFLIETSGEPNLQASCDTSVWKFNYTSGGREYEISQPYNSPDYPINLPLGTTFDTINELFICIKNNSKVEFRLDDTDNLINEYSFIAYDGNRDIIVRDKVTGGEESPTQRFEWVCPPQRSASPRGIHLDFDKVQLPVPKDYIISIDVLNNGLDSLDSVQVFFQIDQLQPTRTDFIFPFPNVLRYTETRTINIGPRTLTSGFHTLRAWTKLPNGQTDLLKVNDDTLEMEFVVISDVSTNIDTLDPNIVLDDNLGLVSFCTDFENPEIRPWVSANPYDLSQLDRTFELGEPSTANISGANSGTNAWVTDLDSLYDDAEAAMLISPFFKVIRDSCYRVTFSHNYHITDNLHDGGTVRYLLPQNQGDYTDNFWDPLGIIVERDTFLISIDTTIIPGDTLILDNDTIRIPTDTIIKPNYGWDSTIVQGLGDTIYQDQKRWYNTRHILSIPDNNRNAGWTGVSNGWITSSSVLIPRETYSTALAWRFESDGTKTSEGWAIDDVCVEKLPPTACYPLSISNTNFEEDELYLGQNIPNPATYSTTIPIYLPKSGMVQFEVINLLGQPIYQENVSRPRGDGIIELDLSSMAKGVYYYTLVLDGKRATKKMIISK